MLKGTLDDFTLPDIFRLMSLAKKTGRLEVARGAGEGRVFFNEGDVYYAESSLSREPLGQKLIRARALTESQLNKALDTHAQTGKRVGDIMIESGMVTSDQIEAAVAQQIEDAVFDLLRWDLGEFTWEAGIALEVEVPISVSVENLIMEASRRLDELEVIQRKIPGDHAILMMAPAPPEGAAEINITPEEWRALVLVDGSRTVGEIGQLIGKDDFETMKILYGLVSAGLVEVDHEATAAAVEAAEQAPEADVAFEEVEEGLEAETEPMFEPEAIETEAAAEAEPVAEAEVAEAEVAGAEVVEPEAAEVVEPEAPEVVEPEAPAAPEVVEPEAPAAELLEAEVVAVEPEGVDELEGLLEGEPAFEPEAEAEVVTPDAGEMPAPPDLEIVGAPEGEAEAIEIEADTGVVGDEVVEAGAFDMSTDDLLSSGAIAEESAVPGPETPEAEAEPATETVSIGDAEDPFLSDLLDQDATEPAPEDVTAPSAEPVAEEEGEGADQEAAEEEPPTVDRAAVVRELAGLFDEDRPKARPAGPQAPPAPEGGPGDQRKRIEDDDQINKGVISRLIKGVKGL